MTTQRSVLGREWISLKNNDRDILTICQKFNVSALIAELILNRGIDLDAVDAYLTPTIKQTLKDPSLLVDMDKAIQRVVLGLEKSEKILIYADYDVDGATSSAILRRYFRDLGHEVGLYIPDRLDEGYGANPQALEKISKQGYTLVIMCDCGTTSFDALAHGTQLGLDIIVIDHHTADVELPSCYALVNPHRLDQSADGKLAFSLMCTAGLAFVFVVALNRALRLLNKSPLPDVMMLLDLVALGTVCDVMPLKGINRSFVAQGLKILKNRHNCGLASLMNVANVQDTPNAYHLGFYLGPRINAGGRVGKADLGSLLLYENDRHLANSMAQQLDTYNKERQTIEMIVLAQAIDIIDAQKLDERPFILVGADGWHPGVIGIVASRIKEKYNKPCIVVGFDGEDGKGSGRSVPGVELGSAMHDAVHRGILTKGGGHAMAVGVSLKKSQFEAFETYLIERFEEDLKAYVPQIKVDATVAVGAVTVDFAKQLMQLEPFGQGNPTPKFRIDYLYPEYVMPVGDGHFRIHFQDPGKNKLEAMAFRVRGTPMEGILTRPHGRMSILGTIKYDTWNGKEKASFFLEDCLLSNDIH
ncbi:MAG: Single-stranded-DNA-specific exonuclease RecJ [Holosporales bacterium]